MTDSSAKYYAIPPSEDEAYHSDVHEAGVTSASRDDPERSSAEARTKWTYFLLGCAILLPWNGDNFSPICPFYQCS